MKEKIRNGILGVCIGDALGVPVEFNHRFSNSI
jgi:ADP-ribosylglycohydrolase